MQALSRSDSFWWRGSEGWLNQHVFRVTPADGIDPTFFYYLLRYLKPNFIGIARNKQTTGLGHVTKRDLENMEGAYPEPPEQRAIAHMLGTLDDKIELLRKQNATLEAMARALFKDWFVDFGPVRAKMEGREPYLPREVWNLFPDRLVESEIEIPEGWHTVASSDLIDFNPTEPLRKETPALYLGMASLSTSGSWPDAPVIRPFGSGMRFRNGDTLLARITPCLENGKAAFIQCLPHDTVGWGSTEYIVLRTKEPVPAEYGYLLARNPNFREHAIRSMTGTSGRQRAQGEAVAAFRVNVPENGDVWRAFGHLVSPMFQSIKSNAEASASLAPLRDSLLPKLISGDLRMKDLALAWLDDALA